MNNRHSKILATLGPSSHSADMVERLALAGASAFRLNFSHGTHDDHREMVRIIRETAEKLGRHIAILQDLQGPKIRLGEVGGAITLAVGDVFTLDASDVVGSKTRAPLPHPEVLETLKVGNRIFINDGLVKLQVTAVAMGMVTCDVLAGGTISSRKGVNLPDIELPFSALSKKDKADLALGLELGVDWVALSFVQRPSDITEAQELIGDKAKIFAKIELPSALSRIDDIIAVTDGIMVARGDLGVEIPLPELPPTQKKLVRLCREAGKPVIVATQMLESMIINASPTRAEVSDVANATYEGADALMLSAESASGAYPEEAVQIMQDVIYRAEKSAEWTAMLDAHLPTPHPTTQDAITAAACNTANTVNATAIVTLTQSGGTALRVSRWRPNQPILALTVNAKTARQLALVWGVTALPVSVPKGADDLVDIAITAAKASGFKKGTLVIVAGMPFGQTGSTNLLRVVEF